MELIDIILDTFIDVAKIIPFLFVIYLILEYMEEHTGEKMERFLKRNRKLNPLLGTLFGLFPTCGFAGAASSLYATHVISAGTLIAIYLASSDEMISIMLGSGAPLSKMVPILTVKLIVGLIAGYGLDLFSRRRKVDIHHLCEEAHDDHSHGIIFSALLHTVQVGTWLLIITFIFNLLVGLIGEETLRTFVQSYPTRSVLVCTIVGMIPSCASSILLTTMYLEGVIPFASVCAGLLVNAGTGFIILFKVNRSLKDNLRILFLTWMIGCFAGWIIKLLQISF